MSINTFQNSIEWLLKAHNLFETFQTNDEFHVRFEMTGFDRLVIERHSDFVSVAHYFEMNGDLIADPEIELHFPTWTPTAITQVISGRREKFTTVSGKEYVDTKFHSEVTSFLVMWGRNIREQGWDKSNIFTSEEATS